MAVRLSQRGRISPVLVASPGMSPGNAGIVTETGFEWVSGWDRITAWPRSPTADIGFRQGLSSTRYSCISASP